MTVTFTDGTTGTIIAREWLAESAYLDYRRLYAVIEIVRKYQPTRVVKIPVDAIGGMRAGVSVRDFTLAPRPVWQKGAA